MHAHQEQGRWDDSGFGVLHDQPPSGIFGPGQHTQRNGMQGAVRHDDNALL